MKADILIKAENQIERLAYSPPALVECGNLHELTHGEPIGSLDEDPGNYFWDGG